jgi:hypothetical protein
MKMRAMLNTHANHLPYEVLALRQPLAVSADCHIDLFRF